MEITVGMTRAPDGSEGSRQISGIADTADTSSYTWYKDIFNSAQNVDAISIRDLLEGHNLSETLHDYAKSFPDSDPRASASYWSLFYFARLTSSYFSAARQGFFPSLDFDDIAVMLEPDGLLKSFHYNPEKIRQITYSDQSAVQSLIEGNLDYFIARMREIAGLSKKLLWNNAAVYIDYALKCGNDFGSARSFQYSRASICSLPCFADGSHNPISGCLKFEECNNTVVCRRKVCCLRYQLPGIPSCGSLCAKSEIRCQSELTDVLSSAQI